MKKYLIILLFAALFTACNEDKTVDVSVMPQETTIGAQTFGCLVDGWLYVGGRFSDEYHNLVADRFPSINFKYYPSNETMDVVVKVEESGYIMFTINNPRDPSDSNLALPLLPCTFTNAKFTQSRNTTEGRDLGDGMVEITRFDQTEGIISGRFESINKKPVSHGQFDVKYK